MYVLEMDMQISLILFLSCSEFKSEFIELLRRRFGESSLPRCYPAEKLQSTVAVRVQNKNVFFVFGPSVTHCRNLSSSFVVLFCLQALNVSTTTLCTTSTSATESTST